MKTIIAGFLFIAVSITSCKQKSVQSSTPTSDTLDKEMLVEGIGGPSASESTLSFILRDTLSLEDAPVKVISARPVEKEYSNYKDIRLSYKNVSGKNITAIRFRWYGINAFNEPADMGTSLIEGLGSGFTDDLLRAGRTTSGQWGILSGNLKKVIKAWPYEVAFEDGTKWALTK